MLHIEDELRGRFLRDMKLLQRVESAQRTAFDASHTSGFDFWLGPTQRSFDHSKRLDRDRLDWIVCKRVQMDVDRCRMIESNG